MSRPRTPTAVLKLRGSETKNPGRLKARDSEPIVSEPLGPPQHTMRPDQRAAWLEIERLAPWLTAADRLAVEVAATLLASFRVRGAEMAPALLTRLESLLGRLGLTPADRSKVTARPPGGERANPFGRNGKRAPQGESR